MDRDRGRRRNDREEEDSRMRLTGRLWERGGWTNRVFYGRSLRCLSRVADDSVWRRLHIVYAAPVSLSFPSQLETSFFPPPSFSEKNKN